MFKLEFEGTSAIVFTSKYYCVKGDKETKLFAKGFPKWQNELRWERFRAVLEGGIDYATNHGFRMHKGSMMTYEQRKLGLSAYYNKRWVLPDGIHKESIQFHLN